MPWNCSYDLSRGSVSFACGWKGDSVDWTNPSRATLKRFFKAGFTTGDIAEPLASFDADRPAQQVWAFMKRNDFSAAGLRRGGRIAGYVEQIELTSGPCGQFFHSFDKALVLEEATPLHIVIPALDDWPRVFVASLGAVGGIVTREDLEKPVARMWLFGLVTMIEMAFLRLIEKYYPHESWREILSARRVEKAMVMQKEQARRRQSMRLVECLQFGDRGSILFQNPEIRQQFGFASSTEAKRVLSRIERLRNHLAHAHPIARANWEIIVRFSVRVDGLLRMLDV